MEPGFVTLAPIWWLLATSRFVAATKSLDPSVRRRMLLRIGNPALLLAIRLTLDNAKLRFSWVTVTSMIFFILSYSSLLIGGGEKVENWVDSRGQMSKIVVQRLVGKLGGSCGITDCCSHLTEYDQTLFGDLWIVIDGLSVDLPTGFPHTVHIPYA